MYLVWVAIFSYISVSYDRCVLGKMVSKYMIGVYVYIFCNIPEMKNFIW